MLTEQTKTKPQETLEFKLNKQMKNFWFWPAKNFSEEKWLLAVTSFEATNFVFNRTNKNSSFSFSTPSHWFSTGGAETINKLQNLLELRSQTDFELHVEEVRNRGNQRKLGDNEHKLSGQDTCENEIITTWKKQNKTILNTWF